MIDELRPLLKKFIVFAKDNLNFKRPPRLFLKQDTANQKCMLGKTAHYDPQKMAITLYVSGRHPKDILRSFSHELVHHCQNERGDLAPEKMKTMNKNYAQENDHMRKMEKEAYLMGNMCFRDWEDGLDDKLQYKMQIAEQKFLKENKNMSVKLKRKDLKGLIEKLLEKRSLKEQNNCKRKKLPDGKMETQAQANKRCNAEDAARVKAGDKKNQDYLAAADEADAKKAEAELKKQFQNKTASSRTSLEEEILDEKGCGAHSRTDDNMNIAAAGKRCDKGDKCPGCPKCKPELKEEQEELEEKKAKPDYIDIDGDGNKKESMKKAASDLKKKKKKKKANESKIQTPEQENALYESRFTGRNTRLFEKLLKEWTK